MMYCERFGFDDERRAAFLDVVELGAQDQVLAHDLQREVIAPNTGSIVKAFYAKMLRQPEFACIINNGGFDIAKLKQTQTDYLLSLGVDFHKTSYFERRLRIGLAHAWAGVPLSLTQRAYRLLQQLLIDCIPTQGSGAHRRDAFVTFVLKITALDLSLIIESYYGAQVQWLEESVSALRDEGGRLHDEVSTDTLTGLASRGHVLGLLEKTLRDAHHNNRSLAVIMADLDFFKKINDRYGHLVGDRVLRGVAARMKWAVRDFDTVGRYGGEEFITVLPNTQLNLAREIAERMRKRVAAGPINLYGQTLRMTISLGLTQARHQDTVDTLIARADAALYAAKQAGRNRVVVDGADASP
ncbi:MAG: GGDEF domain-containing protein [Acidiferrobacterales bacterium]